METLTGVWISLCISAIIFLSVLGLAGLICTLVPPDVRIDRLKAFSCFVCCTFLAGLFYIHVWCLLGKPLEAQDFKLLESSEPPKTRDIHLTVPKDSSVNTQITSGNNIVNITDL